MAFFKAIGVFINECGLSHMMIESNTIASGSVNGLVEEVIDSHSSMPIELPNNVLSAYQKFVEETRQDKDSLYNIATAKPVPENVANFLLSIEKNGEDLRKQCITECAEDQNRFDKPIKKPNA
ncbi:hypothetical protein TNCV_188691 [Trichonephila clavipes]|nr:hypothetical protein TNCV_188691 [Trichonephila clavipes]